MINMTVQEPRTRIVSYKPNGDIVSSKSCIDGVSTSWVNAVVSAAAGAPNYIELVLEKRSG
jgi:hypothetical protein